MYITSELSELKIKIVAIHDEAENRSRSEGDKYSLLADFLVDISDSILTVIELAKRAEGE